MCGPDFAGPGVQTIIVHAAGGGGAFHLDAPIPRIAASQGPARCTETASGASLAKKTVIGSAHPGQRPARLSRRCRADVRTAADCRAEVRQIGVLGDASLPCRDRARQSWPDPADSRRGISHDRCEACCTSAKRKPKHLVRPQNGGVRAGPARGVVVVNDSIDPLPRPRSPTAVSHRYHPHGNTAAGSRCRTSPRPCACPCRLTGRAGGESARWRRCT